ncbi:hypothetical protein [Clostridium butyricum]|nr:hypothetical protein [Clostridium butyricum]
MLIKLLTKLPPVPMPPRNKWQMVGDAIILIMWALSVATGKTK